jgi:hypothetical protein
VEHVTRKLGVSERRVRRVIDQPRSTQRLVPVIRDDEECLRAEIVKLAVKYGRYGYRRITALLKREGFRVNHKREEGLKVPKKQPKRGRLGSMTAPVFVFGQPIETMSGLVTLWQSAPMTAGPLRF